MAVAVTLALAFALAPTAAGGQVTGTDAVGSVLEHLEAPTADGDTWALDAVTDEVVVLHLCAGWCDPCQQLAMQLGTEIAGLEDVYGAENFEIVEVLVEGTNGGPSTAEQAGAWRDTFTGDGIEVLHAGGNEGSSVQELAQRVGLDAYPTLVVLDGDRRIIDVRAPGSPVGAFAAAIEHAAAVSALPSTLSYDARLGGVDVRIGGGTGTQTFVTPALETEPENATVELTDGAVISVGHQRSLASPPGSLDWWSRIEHRTVTLLDHAAFGAVTPPSELDVAPATVEVSLTDLHWDDGIPRAIAAYAVAVARTTDGPTLDPVSVEVPVSYVGGTLTLGPLDLGADGQALAGVVFEIDILPVLDAEPEDDPLARIEQLRGQLDATALTTGERRSFSAQLTAAERLLTEAPSGNDDAGLQLIRVVEERLTTSS